jgi:hypothetical protein
MGVFTFYVSIISYGKCGYIITNGKDDLHFLHYL